MGVSCREEHRGCMIVILTSFWCALEVCEGVFENLHRGVGENLLDIFYHPYILLFVCIQFIV